MLGLRRPVITAPLVAAALLLGLSASLSAHPRADFPAQSAGSRGIDVTVLQHLLRDRGYDTPASGEFGSSTQTALARFQQSAGLEVSGAATAETWERLVKQLADGSTGEAVIGLQQALNRKRNSGLAVNGTYDDATRSAVRSFQGNMGLPVTGVVNSRTWRNLLWHYVKPSFSLAGLCNYNGGNAGADWATGSAAGMLEAAAIAFHGRTGSRVAVGDISWQKGGNIILHATHEDGLDVDLALVRRDRNQCRRPGIGYRSNQYDRDATRQLIRAIYEAAPYQVKLVYFNDPVLIGEGLVQRYPRHDDHIHVRYCEVGHRLARYRCSAPPLDAAPLPAPPEALPEAVPATSQPAPADLRAPSLQ